MKKLLFVVAALWVASAADASPKFHPFLYWTDLDSSYQGTGWINRDFIVGCHETYGEGEEKLTECRTSRTVEVEETPHGHIIAGLIKGMNVIVGKRSGKWVKVDTSRAQSIAPGSAVDWNHPDVYLSYCPEKSQ